MATGDDLATVVQGDGMPGYGAMGYGLSDLRRERYAWLYDDEDIWASPVPALSPGTANDEYA